MVHPDNQTLWDSCKDEEPDQEEESWSEELQNRKKDLLEEVQRLRTEVDLTSDATKISNLALHEANAKASALDVKLQEMLCENVRLMEERGSLKRETERLEDMVRSIVRAIAQEVPIDEGLSKNLSSCPRDDAAAYIKDMQEALHVYIEHCEHQVSFPLKSALFSVRSELADAQANLWTLQHKLMEEIQHVKDQGSKDVQNSVDEAFCGVNESVQKMKLEVEELKLQYSYEVAKIKQEFHEMVNKRNVETAWRMPNPGFYGPQQQACNLTATKMPSSNHKDPVEKNAAFAPRGQVDKPKSREAVPKQGIVAESQTPNISQDGDGDISNVLHQIDAIQIQSVQ